MGPGHQVVSKPTAHHLEQIQGPDISIVFYALYISMWSYQLSRSVATVFLAIPAAS
jgi:hypothetical protein